MNVDFGRTIDLLAQVESSTEVTFKWFRNGIELTDERYKYVNIANCAIIINRPIFYELSMLMKFKPIY